MLRLVIPDTNEVVKDTQTQNSRKCEVTTECRLASPGSRQKRADTKANPSLKQKPRIIFDEIKCQSETKSRTFMHICAKTFLKVASFLVKIVSMLDVLHLEVW